MASSTEMPQSIWEALSMKFPHSGGVSGSFFDSLQNIEPTEKERELERNKRAQEELEKHVSMWHPEDRKDLNSLRARVKSGDISPSDYYTATGRIYSGGTGDTAMRDARGNITGYTSKDGSGRALSGPSGTPGLDALHKMGEDEAWRKAFPVAGKPAQDTQAGKPKQGKGFDFLPQKTTAVPQSVMAGMAGSNSTAGIPQSILKAAGPKEKWSQTVSPLGVERKVSSPFGQGTSTWVT